MKFKNFLESSGDTKDHKYSKNTLTELQLLLKHHEEDLSEYKNDPKRGEDDVKAVEHDIKEIKNAIKQKEKDEI